MDKQDNPIFQRSYPSSEMCNQKLRELPIWEKPLLTVVEAAKYFQIGESNIRRITREHKDEDFIQWKDSRVFIRREEFEKFLDRTNVI